jgi:hypothetical protein
MKFKELVAELKRKESYNDFTKKYPDAYLSAGFFILSTDEKESDKVQIDFFIPSEKKIASFKYPFNSFQVHEDEIKESSEITNLDIKIDIMDLFDFGEKRTSKKFNKVIAILKDDIWNATYLLGLDIQRMKFCPYTGDMKSEDKGMLTDFIKMQKKD